MSIHILRGPVRFPRRVLLLLFVVCAVVSIAVGSDEEEDPQKLGCHKRKYNFRVTQTDKKGRSCWDLVSVKSCWGRCDSNEISDYKFPFKRSFHPVCIFSGRIPSVAILRNCDADVEPLTNQYHYMEATSCKCQTCSSADTSCEAPKEIHHPFASKIMDLYGGGSSVSTAGIAEEYAEYN